jgi:hypothetical protein
MLDTALARRFGITFSARRENNAPDQLCALACHPEPRRRRGTPPMKYAAHTNQFMHSISLWEVLRALRMTP